MSRMDDFEKELEGLLNRYSRENDSNTPDFILARYLVGCLEAWNAGVTRREEWYGRSGTAPATIAQQEMLNQTQHDWEFYANGSFCKRCGAAIGSGTPCR